LSNVNFPAEKAKDRAFKLPEVCKSSSDHFKNFLLAGMGQEQTRSSFATAGPLSQYFVSWRAGAMNEC
jgi:hypothetical protein